eukprot:COSAG05_NODE_15913_length_358_cov_0.745174_1_plen_96_part_01
MFKINTGEGGEGKGTIWSFFKAVFGSMASSMDAKWLQCEPQSPGTASSDLYALRYVRIVTVTEPDGRKSIKTDIMKKISGNDKIWVRALYKDAIEI